jgi:hypothetical protein
LHSGASGSGGTQWTAPERVVTLRNLYALAGSDGGPVYAAGEGGLVLRYDGEDWQTMATGQFDRLNAIDVGPCGSIHAAGHWGLILEYDD